MQPDLAGRVEAVPNQADVYASDLAAALALEKHRQQKALPASERSAEEIAVDGVAHYVFNTLRGLHDQAPTKWETQVVDEAEVQVPVEWATFEDVRAIVAKARF